MRYFLTSLLFLLSLPLARAASDRPDSVWVDRGYYEWLIASKDQLNEKIDQLTEELNQLRKAKPEKEESESAKKLKQQLKDEQSRSQELLLQHQQDSVTIAELTATITDLSRELAQYADIRNRWFDQLIADASLWENRPYSTIDLQALEQAMSPYRQYASENEGIKGALEKMEKLRSDYQLYKDAELACTAAYEGEKVKSLVSRLQEVMSRENQPDRQKELFALENKLKEYSSAVMSAQDLIKSIEKQYNPGDVNNVKYGIQGILDKEEDTYGTISLMKSYPWLNEQFEEYISFIKRVGVGSINAVRDTILNL